MPDPGPDDPALEPTLVPERPATAEEDLSTLPGVPGSQPSMPGSAAAGSFPITGWERYDSLELLGRGGMGEVYKARDRRLGRTVALKFILGSDPDLVMRFLQEARAQARIDHPNICKVHEVGEFQGKAYIAMQFIEGQRLDKAASAMSQPVKVRLMLQVATAIHEAHRQGIVHRDLKPSNIMVERAEDGSYVPFVMDFGLAYDSSHGHGLTLAGALMGTPSYMAPEQARGELASVDRRSDVYSLGATLYELLAGEAPFTDATVLGTLAKVLHEEPPSLHRRVPQIERDLEIIVLKCLSKEPGQRYPSARALAEDLSRFIDGESILGQRPSLRYRVRRLARKNRALVAVSAVSLATILVLATLGVRAWLQSRRTQQQSEARAQLAEHLGQEMKEIEWFLRLSYAMPLHDTSHEQQLVRERMARIASQPSDLGVLGEGLIHYALGRGHLALHEFDKAHDELVIARQRGLNTPELHYALGRALGELYHQALEDARRSGDKDWLVQRQQELEQKYLEPALQSLEHSRGTELESPRYLEGLIAFYRRQYDVAAQAAAQASAQAPWMPEARKLAGDVARAQAVESPSLDYDSASAGLHEAVRLYEQSIELGRSDALNYEALAEVWLRQSELDEKQGKPQAQALEHALAAADKAIQAAPLRSAGHTQKAYALMRQFFMASFNQAKLQDARPLLEEWIATGQRAVELNPEDVSAYDALGNGYSQRGEQQTRDGQDPSESWNQAVVWLSRALKLQPNHPWALNDLGVVHLSQGQFQQEHGEDPHAAYTEAIRRLEQAVRVDPKYLYAHANLGSAYSAMGAYALSQGRDPQEEVKKTLEVVERSLLLDPNYYGSLNQAATAELSQAQYLVDLGQDPRVALDVSLGYVDRSLHINPSMGRTHLIRAMCFDVEAAHALLQGRDPGAALERGRQSLDRALQLDAGCVDCRVERARVELTAAAWEQARGGSGLPFLQRALTEAQRAVEMYPYAAAHQELARAYWRLAQVSAPAQAAPAVAKGLKQVELALKLDSGLAHPHAIHSGLLLLQARTAGPPEQRLKVLQQARADLIRAFEIDPLLRRQYELILREVEQQLARKPD
jgi:hypothetical protein